MSNLLSITNESPPTIPPILQLLDRVESLEVELMLANTTQCKNDMPIEASLIQQGVVSEHQIAVCYSKHYLLRLFDPPTDAQLPIDPGVRRLLSKETCLNNVIAPLTDDGRTIEVALFVPDSFRLAETIREQTGRQMRSLFAPLSVVCRVQQELYDGVSSADAWQQPEPSVSLATTCPSNFAAEATQSKQQTSPIAEKSERYIRRVFRTALQHRAERIYLERFENACRVRLFVGGKIIELAPPPDDLANGVISTLKSLGKMDVREMAFPQDGSIFLTSDDRRIEAKVSICPTIFGGNVMMNIFDVC